MRVIELVQSVVIARSIEEVFAFVTDRTNDHRWWSGVMTSRAASSGLSGATQVHRLKMLGRVFETPIEVTDHDPPRSVTIRSQAGLTPFTACCTFTPAAGGTTFTLHARLRALGIFQLGKPLVLIPVMHRQVRGNFRRLKELLESERERDRHAAASEISSSPSSPFLTRTHELIHDRPHHQAA